MSTGLAEYYDRLGRWNRIARAIGYGGGSRSLTVHRALADPRANGRVTYTRLHDLLVESLAQVRNPRVLDAGCGLGGTMLALADALRASCTGLTLSSSQAATANAAAAQAGVAHRVHALTQSYDAPPPGPFDVIVAIESLAHSSNPARTIAGLVAVLAPGGRMVIVDDMPEPDADSSAALATFKRGWECPVLWTAADYLRAFAELGLEMEKDVDLTGSVRPRSAARVAALAALNRAAYLVPSQAFRQVLDSHRGGLALEDLIRNRLVRYRLLIARRPELQVS